MKTEKVKLKNWNAEISFDKAEKLFIITYDGIGGAIIANANREVAERKWIDSMQLSDSVRKASYFIKYNTFPN